MHQWTQTVQDTGHKYSVSSGIVPKKVGFLVQEMVQSYYGQMELETWVTELKSNNYKINFQTEGFILGYLVLDFHMAP